jgi:hypothetical protein
MFASCPLLQRNIASLNQTGWVGGGAEGGFFPEGDIFADISSWQKHSQDKGTP